MDTPVAAWRSSDHVVLGASSPLNWQPWHQSPQSERRDDQRFPELESVLAEENPSLARLQGSLKQRCELWIEGPTKPPLKDLQLEIAHFWQQGRGLDREGRIEIVLVDCFRALKQKAGIMHARAGSSGGLPDRDAESRS